MSHGPDSPPSSLLITVLSLDDESGNGNGLPGSRGGNGPTASQSPDEGPGEVGIGGNSSQSEIRRSELGPSNPERRDPQGRARRLDEDERHAHNGRPGTQGTSNQTRRHTRHSRTGSQSQNTPTNATQPQQDENTQSMPANSNDGQAHQTPGADMGEDTPIDESEEPLRCRRNNRPMTTNQRLKKNTRANIKIASLNMQGRGAQSTYDPKNKWNLINQVVRENRIAILATQETHLSDTHADEINDRFCNLRVIHSIDADHPNAKGVAIVLNKRLTNVENIETYEIIPGRALMIVIPWHAELKLAILNVYAPNAARENGEFWTTLKGKWEDVNSRLPFPDLMLGDFNVVEDAIDRLPSHPDSPTAAEPLADLKSTFQLQDGWREVHPTDKKYSFFQKATGSQSRIDRIYTTPQIINNSKSWEIKHTAIPTDHQMVTIHIENYDSPFIGKGRWTIPLHLLKDRKLIQEIEKMGIDLQEKIDGAERTEMVNPQTLFKEFKDGLVKAAKERSKTFIAPIDQKIRKLQLQLKLITRDTTLSEDEMSISSALIEEELKRLEQKRFTSTRAHVTANNQVNAEVIGKYWSNMNRMKTPRDTIQRLKKPRLDLRSPEEFETRSNEMAELAREYHEGLQKEGQNADPEERAKCIEEVMEYVTAPASNREKARMAEYIKKEEVIAALQASTNGKAAGIDGIPYELWKIMQYRHDDQSKRNTPSFNIIDVLQKVYADIERHGVANGTGFAEGWMCPLYKKRDKSDIANYRPITLLNTDYKIFTKALQMKLGEVAPSLIHENQAGFMPGRSIFDQVKMVKLMTDYAEAMEENGVIIALDQEKAYDKVAHDYLWKTLAQFNLPDHFIKTIRSLYENAETKVIVNGVMSSPYRVIRGVRQGDPLSCLLFNLAIEPLATMLRQSNLRGFQIPGLREKIITLLFADDTTVFLSQGDKFEDLENILKKWCAASTAKFNINKTEIIPVGQQLYRTEVLRTRKIDPNSNQDPIPEHVHLAKEGEMVRILGSWIGNNINQSNPWSPVIEKIELYLAQWAKSHPTMEGRRLIVQMFIGGMTQYLTKVQGMPKHIEERLENLTRSYIWDGRKPSVNLNTIYMPIEKGGRKVLDIKARNKAITLTWLRDYLKLDTRRPSWAYVADALINRQILASDNVRDDESKVNMFLQTWKVNTGPSSRLPQDLIKMIKAGKEFNVAFEALAVSEKVKKLMPLWFHPGMAINQRKDNNSAKNTHLRRAHDIVTVGDAVKLVNRPENPRHENDRDCVCMPCQEDRFSGCENPSECMKHAKKLILRLSDKWRPDATQRANRNRNENEDREDEGEKTLFNPDFKVDSLREGFRVFTNPQKTSHTPAKRLELDNDDQAPDSLQVYTDGSCLKNGDEDARAGSGIWYGPDDGRNSAIRVPGEEQSNQTGEINAILQVAKVSPMAPLHIISDSQYVIKGLTKYLPSWEDRGWIGIHNRKLLKSTVSHLRKRGNTTYFEWVKGHSDDPGNDGADALALEGALKPEEPMPDDDTPENFDLTGAKLAAVTQALLHEGIREIEAKKTPLRRQTEINLEMAKEAVKQLTGMTPTSARIWTSIRKKDFSRTTREFFWKCIHNVYKVGHYWAHIPNYENRAICSACNTEDSMEHILTQCDAPGQKQIWEMIEEVWNRKHGNWQKPSYGTILGCSVVDFKDENGKVDAGKTRLFRILIAEATTLIWALRCSRVIEHDNNPMRWPSIQQVTNQLTRKLNTKLRLDCLMTSVKTFDKKALRGKLASWGFSGYTASESS
ncbi:Transposon TX1 uncharacterized protein [Hypsizygus marmoreus]|uniref:Transposon TX1 uncharacterized protein n=1 Tax=Hypsizygus marmoreus TaxID=39966 RepID=A0A369JM58_HYPMA|nr:Transposon TX1 uncharacterized protein [Hypsizygus marmoreus]